MHTVLVLAAAFLSAAQPSPGKLEMPVDFELPGPHMGQAPPAGFGDGQPLTAVYYFYWYDQETGYHFIEEDGSDALTNHPVETEGYSYKNVSWHKGELRDMVAARLDVVLPVYWGSPGNLSAGVQDWTWSDLGLRRFVEAYEDLKREGMSLPKIGMSFDTTSLAWNGAGVRADLATPEGRARFYETIRNFFSQVPPEHWACIEGKPLVFMYVSSFIAGGADDEDVLGYTRRRFAEDFGGAEPYIIMEHTWSLPDPDAVILWGGSTGVKVYDAASIGPGYDETAISSRTGYVVPREGGDLYDHMWSVLLAMDPAARPAIVAIETWNEWHEGTDIAHSKEFGRKYIGMTRKYAALWRQGAHVEADSPYAEAKEVAITFGPEGESDGLVHLSSGDGVTRHAIHGGVGYAEALPHDRPDRYIYLLVNDFFYFTPQGPVEIVVTYLDETELPWAIEYDSTDPSPPFLGAYKQTRHIQRRDTGEWKKAAFRLDDARFANRQNLSADLRIYTPEGAVKVSKVTIRKLGNGGG